jgi:hypothetical protein
MKLIGLTRGKFTKVDDELYDYLNQWKWLYHRSGYAIRMVYNKITKGYDTVYIHREINGTPDGLFTDHIDRDRLNNQKDNLRSVTHAQNLQNTTAHSNSTTGLKGVSKARSSYVASIRIKGKKTYTDSFKTPEEAKIAYDDASKKHHGEFSRS